MQHLGIEKFFVLLMLQSHSIVCCKSVDFFKNLYSSVKKSCLFLIFSPDTDVFVLSGGNDVIECHGLQTNTSYKLYLQKDTGELCFIKVPIGSDGNEKRIPLRRIQTIVKNKKERILTLQVRVAGRTQVQNVTLSVSSLDTLCADLRGDLLS